MTPKDSFLGQGWGFPVTFSKRAGKTVRMVSEEADIRESLSILFTTRPGERVMRPDFGGSLEELLFEPNNVGLLTYVKEQIRTAVLYYEPRVDLVEIVIEADGANEGRLLIELQLEIRATNSRFNFVFP
ncbi:MAG: GPW/gp25 family protein, partial [Bacteroidota bacterium]